MKPTIPLATGGSVPPHLSAGLHPNGPSSKVSRSPSTAEELVRASIATSSSDEAGVILKWQTDLFEHGKRRAVESGALEPLSSDLAALESHAGAIAREAERAGFNPAQIGTHDQLRDDEHKKALRDREEAEPAVKFATAEVREREAAAAELHPGDAPAQESVAVRAAAVVAIMISTAPTLHDFIFTIGDDFIAWVFSMLCGLFLGLWITLMILGDHDAAEHRTVNNWIGLASGIFISVALGALRLKGASSFGDIVFALAMTLLDLGIVLGLESIARNRRVRYQDWHVHKIAYDKADKALEMAKVHLERCKNRLKELNDAITGHIRYVEGRAIRSLHIDQIEATLLKAVRDGYHAGIAQNRGRILGTRVHGYE